MGYSMRQEHGRLSGLKRQLAGLAGSPQPFRSQPGQARLLTLARPSVRPSVSL